jgi:hypothetical protein
MAITKEDMENLYHLTGEITDLEREIKKLEGKLESISCKRNNYVGDTYRDYSSNAKGSLKIVRGYGLNENTYKTQQAYYESLRLKRNELIKKKMILEEELEKIDDVIIRRIIRLKFYDRFSWESVAIAVDPTKSGEAMRKRLERFFENVI